MNVNFQNQIHHIYEDKTSDSFNEFHQSNGNSEDEIENHTLMIAEDEEIEHDIQLKDSKAHRKNANETSSSAGKGTNISTLDKYYKMTSNSVENGIFESQTDEDSEVKEKKYKTGSKQQFSNKVTLPTPANPVFEHQSKRKRGRPERCFQVTEEFDNEPIIKRARGRPKKIIEKMEFKEKKSVGRPRVYFNTEPKEKKPIGRPRKYFHLKINKEQKAPGRPRTKFRLKFIKEKRPRGRPRANLQLKVIKENRSRGRPRKNFDIVKEKRSRGRPKSNFKLLPPLKQKTENTELIRKRGRPKKFITPECNKLLRIKSKSFNDKPSCGDVCNDTNKLAKIASTENNDIPKRKRGRPKKLIRRSRFGGSNSINEEGSRDSPDHSESVNINDIKLEKI